MKIKDLDLFVLIISITASLLGGVIAYLNIGGDLAVPSFILFSSVSFILFYGGYIISDRITAKIDKDKFIQKIEVNAFRKRKEDEGEARLLDKDEVTVLEGFEANISGWMKIFVKEQASNIDEFRILLRAAGISGKDPVITYIIMRLAIAFIVSLFSFFAITYVVEFGEGSEILYRILVALITFVVFYLLGPRFLLSKVRDRGEIVGAGIVDAVDIMGIYISSGVPFDRALEQTAYNLAPIRPEMSSEFLILARELATLSDRPRAFDNFMKRVQIRSAREFIAIVKQADKDGTPMSDAFKKLSTALGRERILKLEQKFASVPIKIIFVSFIFILPTFFTLMFFPTVYEGIQTFSGARNEATQSSDVIENKIDTETLEIK